MRRFALVGLTLVLLAGSASAQTVYNVTTFKTGRGKTSIIEPAVPPQPAQPVLTPAVPPQPAQPVLKPALCLPMGLLCCLLPDQPALLCRLAMMNAAYPAVLDDKKPVEEKKADGKEVVPALPPPATMIALNPTDWECGRRFKDERGSVWCLVKGCPLPERPLQLRGWLLESAAKNVYFVDSFGNIYRRIVVVPAP